MGFNYEIAEKVWNELESLDIRSSKEKTEIAQKLCEKNGIEMSDLFVYEDYLERQKKAEMITIDPARFPEHFGPQFYPIIPN